MSTLETRSYNNKRPIDNQWVREHEMNESYYKNSNMPQDNFQDLEEAKEILRGINALQSEDLEELRIAKERLEKVESEKEPFLNYRFDGEFLFESEEEHEKEIERIMG